MITARLVVNANGMVLLWLTVVKGPLLGVSVFDLMQKTMIGAREHAIGCGYLFPYNCHEKGT